jgi:hypothetical protein
MSRANAPRGRGRGADPQAAARRLAVGRPLQARLIALEKQIGLFSEEQSLVVDNRFHHPVIVPAGAPVPEGMQRLFGAELAALERLGHAAGRCHAVGLGPYRVHCVSCFHYDGFRALVYVEQDGSFVVAWKDEEVLQPDSPRVLLAGVDDAQIEAFLAHVSGS